MINFARISSNGPTANLPRLAYISDVPPDRTVAGSLLIHRLLAEYDPERLSVTLGNIIPSAKDCRLPGVTYDVLKYAPARLLRTRLHPWVSACLVAGVPFLVNRIIRRLKNWAAEAVVTVPQFFLWRIAALAAVRLKLPLILICHDDWTSCTAGANRAGMYYRNVFRRHYRQAVSRLCVSPGMAEYYEKMCRVPGVVFYPNRGDDSPEQEIRVRNTVGGPPVVAYAGSLHNPGYVAMIRRMGELLASIGGRIDLYTPSTESELAAKGLVPPAINLVGFFPPKAMAARMAATATVLFSPVSYLPEEACAMRTNFPSKLVDYTAIGLPILIWGPENSSAVRWARDNSGAAVVVTDQHGDGILQAVTKLTADPIYAREVASRGLAAGGRDFDLATARTRFYNTLMNLGRPKE